MMIYALIFITKYQCSAFSGKDHVKWLIDKFGTLTVSDVQNIFDRVSAAADKRMNRLPKLLILKDAGDPWAMCRKDGMIILTQKAVEFCYKNVEKNTGDARIAFIIGHELAHLANDDFHDLEVSQAVHGFSSDSEAFQQIQAMFVKSEKDKEDIQKKELKADGYGLLYAAMAGYSPKAAVTAEGKNFFQEWANLTTGKIAYSDNTHPEPEQRSAFLLSEMAKVKNHLILFEIAVRLFQLGMYKDSLYFLETFQTEFPCREVFNNIGLIYFQIAMKKLAEIKPDKAYQYRLASILDTVTRAVTFRGEEEIEDELAKAKRNFEYACDQDSFYVPSRVNLSSVLIMNKDYHGAVTVLNEALKLGKDDPKILNNMVIAKYLWGIELKSDKSEEAVRILKELTEKHQEYADPFFNLGRILSEKGKDSEAKEIWKKYLFLESSGEWAKIAEKYAGEKSISDNQKRFQTFKMPCPVSPGKFDENAEKILDGLQKQSFELADIPGEYYIGEDFQVLVLEDEIIFVQSRIREKTDFNEIISEYGRPIRISDSYDGGRTLVYDKFALDIKDGMVISVICY